MRFPGFIIGGAPRSGTTWLYHLADRHPHIAMAKPAAPEPKFFLIDEAYAGGLQAYAARWFDPLPAGRLYGEKSTNYLESPIAARRISRDLPGVRLIFVLRDPVLRAYSNFVWSTQNGHETESFERALEREASREADLPAALRYARPYAYFSRGLYADLLAPWFALFPREQILILTTEHIANDPAALATRLFAFLGVEDVPGLGEGLGRVNQSAQAVAEGLDPQVRRRLAERYREPNARLAALTGERFTSWEMFDEQLR